MNLARIRVRIRSIQLSPDPVLLNDYLKIGNLLNFFVN